MSRRCTLRWLCDGIHIDSRDLTIGSAAYLRRKKFCLRKTASFARATDLSYHCRCISDGTRSEGELRFCNIDPSLILMKAFETLRRVICEATSVSSQPFLQDVHSSLHSQSETESGHRLSGSRTCRMQLELTIGCHQNKSSELRPRFAVMYREIAAYCHARSSWETDLKNT